MSAHCWSSSYNRRASGPRKTRLRYLGTQTRWYCKRWVVWAPTRYLLMHQACRITYASASSAYARSREPFIPGLERPGFSGTIINNNSLAAKIAYNKRQMGKALYRTYRSKKLSEIVGQEHITTALDNALKKGTISHAYLFTGPRGVGKTSIARILAHEINGLPYTDDSTHMDIIEIDAASN